MKARYLNVYYIFSLVIILSKFDLVEKLNAIFENLISGKYAIKQEKNGIFY